MMIQVELEPDIESKLNQLASDTHVALSFVVKEALVRLVEDREDYLAGIAALAEHRYTISQEEMEQRSHVQG